MTTLSKRGPKRKQPLSGEHMETMTARLPSWMILRLEEEAAKLARSTGVATINRSDVLRRIIESALQAK